MIMKDDEMREKCNHGISLLKADECLDCRSDEMMARTPYAQLGVADRRKSMIEAHIETLDQIFGPEFARLNHVEQNQVDNLVMDIERISLVYGNDPIERRLAVVTAYRALLVRAGRE